MANKRASPLPAALREQRFLSTTDDASSPVLSRASLLAAAAAAATSGDNDQASLRWGERATASMRCGPGRPPASF